MTRRLRIPPARLLAAPRRLRSEVEKLSKASGPTRPSESRLAEFRARVATEPASLVAQSMIARQHRWLGHLASEGDPHLGSRVAAVAHELVRLERTTELLLLVPWLPSEKALVRALAGVAQKDWGTPRIPEWVAVLDGGPQALLDGDLAPRFVEQARAAGERWPQLVKGTHLPADSPLALGVLQAAVTTTDARWVAAQDDREVARWTAGQSLPRDIAINALVRLLQSRAGSLSPKKRLQELAGGGLRDLMNALEGRVGGPLWKVPRLWADIPEEVRALARLARSIQIVLRNFEPRRREFWLPWLAEAQGVEAIRTGVAFGREIESGGADAVLIKLRGRCFLEFSTTNHACYAYSEADWDRIRRSSPIPTSHSLKMSWYVRGPNWLTHQGDYWESKFHSYISRLDPDA